MDEVEFKVIYNQAINALQAKDYERTLLLALQLLNGLRETIEDMQQEEDDC